MVADILHFGDMVIRRKEKRHAAEQGQCVHLHVTMEPQGEIITCDDCSKQLSAYWLLSRYTAYWAEEEKKLSLRESVAAAARDECIHLIAAKKVEAVWRTRKMVPGCPHCARGILAEDRLGSVRVNREMELRRRAADAAAERSP